MSSLVIRGGHSLNGKVRIQGSKNAALPMMAAALLIPGITRLNHCPVIADVTAMAELLQKFGVRVWREEEMICLDASNVHAQPMRLEDTKKTRACVLLLGALLGRCQLARMAYPGGCVIGDRPVDLHLMAFRSLGAAVTYEEEISCSTTSLCGGEISFPISSVGATQNAILAAVLAKGDTRIHQAAREPEVQTLCHFLNAAGAKISGIGSRHLKITGVDHLREISYDVPADRIVAGTYLAAVMAAKGRVMLEGAPAQELTAVITPLRDAGGTIECLPDGILASCEKRLEAFDYLCTAPYPGFPTDMQPQFVALAAGAQGTSLIEESIFNARFRAAQELVQMGAEIYVQEGRILINGRERLVGAAVRAADLRGGAAMVIAALQAEGNTRVEECEYLARGYESIVRDLSELGADIDPVQEEQKSVETMG